MTFDDRTPDRTPDRPPEQERQGSSIVGQARGVALGITNLTKLAGLAIAVNELIFRPDFRPAAAALAAFMMAGAQVSETALLSLIDRFFGTDRR